MDFPLPCDLLTPNCGALYLTPEFAEALSVVIAVTLLAVCAATLLLWAATQDG